MRGKKGERITPSEDILFPKQAVTADHTMGTGV